MCGIVGYVGEKKAVPILVEGLKRLEYRGYDSSGVGIISPKTGKIIVRKTQGKIKDLVNLIQSQHLPPGSVGISHTRWATHGAPNKTNSHPHFDSSRRFLVVHNGIIENYEEIKQALKKKGHKFVSETDTEVISQLIGSYYKNDLLAAVQKAIKKLKGAFAIGVISSLHPDTLIAARIGSPLIIGIGKNENFIASDVPAILNHTKKIIYLKDGEMALVKRDRVKVFTFAGKPVKAKINTIAFKLDSVEKQGYPHFMLKEIYEQPSVVKQMLALRLKNNRIHINEVGLTEKQFKSINHIVIIACGTAYHAGMVGKYIIEKLSSIPVSIDVSSEFRYRDPLIKKGTMVIAISQSGETADTLAAIREAKSKGAKIISIINAVGSSITRESDGVLYTHAGPEIGVASTKAYTAQICMLYLLALKLASAKKTISRKEIQGLIKDLKQVPSSYGKILKKRSQISRIAKKNSHFGCFLFLGRNINYPSAMEGALKLKEISYIPAEGYAAGEMKHGPIALIDEYRAVVCVVPQSDIYEKMISNMQEILSRKGKIIAIATEGDESIKKHAHYVVYVPSIHQLLTPLLVALPLQLLAYYIAVNRGCDVDQPRNLAKSVTVE